MQDVPSSNKYSTRLNNCTSNANCEDPIALFLSLKSNAQTTLTPKLTNPNTLNAHANPIDGIIAPVASEYTKPPSPDPAVAIPLAKLLLVVNHCGTMPTEPTNRNPMPKPKQMPWLRKSCHI